MADKSAEAASAGKEKFVCIECGSFAESLFIQYAAGTIKLKQCVRLSKFLGNVLLHSLHLVN